MIWVWMLGGRWADMSMHLGGRWMSWFFFFFGVGWLRETDKGEERQLEKRTERWGEEKEMKYIILWNSEFYFNGLYVKIEFGMLGVL